MAGSETASAAASLLAEIQELLDGLKRGEPRGAEVNERTPSAPSGSSVMREHILGEILRDLLRPMLQRWIDEHMPSIVEQEVLAALREAEDEPDDAATKT